MMTEVFKRMLRNNDDESPDRCRERRRRRIEMRNQRLSSSIPTPRSISLPTPTENSIRAIEEVKPLRISASDDLIAAAKMYGKAEAEAATAKLSPEVVPEFGAMSVAGRSREMEDAIDVRINLCRPEINHNQPVHFFAVFDGHGGAHVAGTCRDEMHVFVKEELMRLNFADVEDGGGYGAEAGWRKALERSFERMDEFAMNVCKCHPIESALCGSTAVVALVTAEHVVVANVGDSRAVLCRAGKSVPLSFDHKPDRPDELARVQAAGGRVLFLNGARVEGILAMSRAIGDKYLKPIVTSEPEITITKRNPEDEFFIIASDGIWDVISNNMACAVALKCFKDGWNDNTLVATALGHNAGSGVGEERGVDSTPTRSAMAATLLTRLALARRSDDNISTIVVDLERFQ